MSKKIKADLLQSEALPGLLLLVATIIALIMANTPLDGFYNYVLYHVGIGEEFNLHFLINEFLMALFFLVVGCEIKREFVHGNLSSVKDAAFPIITAVGGMAVPALIFTIFNFGTPFEVGVGIPLSTDIAFAIGIFTILKSRMNMALEVFLLTLAVVDDLLSIIIIGVFYSSEIRVWGLVAAAVIVVILLLVRKMGRLNNLYTYCTLGLLLWAAIFYSGIHSTLAGVILGFTIPVYDESNRHKDLSHRLQHGLEGFTNFIVLPLFAFANTGINLRGSISFIKDYRLMVGIILALVVGKPIGILLFGFIGDKIHIAKKPEGTSWYDILVVSVIAGIGFTMSLFITELAFAGGEAEVKIAKISILIAAVISTVLAYLLSLKRKNTVF